IVWFFSIKGFWKKLILAGVFAALIGFILFGSVFAYYSFNLPDPNKLADRIVPESTKIFDRNGKLLYEIRGEAKRTLIKLEDVPDIMKQATIAVEDKNFYNHGGISLTGILRSIIVNIFSGSLRQGGSTITQQFVRAAVLSREKTFARKFKEIALSLQLERRYSKDEILRLYLNEIPYGSNAYGIQAASQTFFGKNVQDLELVEAAYLAAMPQAPTYYSPYGLHQEDLDARADTVLQLMYEQEYITAEQRNRTQNQKIEFRNIGQGILAPHFVLYIQDLLAQKYGEVSLQEGGLKVTTTLDYELQSIAEEIITRQLETNETKYNVHNASLVAIDPRTGQILTMVGSRDYFNEEYDGAVNVALRPRQPGSSFKPYVYATAFQKGMNPATMLFDIVTNFGEFGGEEYTPQNYDGKERGPVSIRAALQGSLNIPAVKTLILTGVEDSIQTAESMGITTLKNRSRFGPSLVLGGAEVKLLEHTAAYGVFAAGGVRQEIVSILKVEDKDGKILEEYKESRGKEVLNPQIAYQINNILSDNESRVYIFGRNNRLSLPDRPAAAKTGTTQEYKDAWIVGYVPSLVTGVWMGNNNNSAMTGGASGSLLPAAVWNEFMRRALAGKPVEAFTRPEGIIEMQVDSLSGKLPTAYTPSTKTEIFTSFNAPTESDDIHMPDGTRVLASEKPDDPAWEDPVRAWALANGYLAPADDGTKTDPTIKIDISSPNKITALPWKAGAQIETDSDIREVRFILDGYVLYSTSNNPYEYEGNTAHADGTHNLTVWVQTQSNKTAQKTVKIDFALGKSVVLLSPTDNQILRFPTNLVLESSLNVAAENVKFTGRSASGSTFAIGGKITKQQIGSIYYYTLNWAENQKPAPGSYSISAEINGQSSDLVTVKIQ
ncbi:MAG: penicillin-binding protein, partial [Candidatus Doudnabacteria bacterium]|nr:penicillin-binding protein [Candidatus Doudnabacteria bacterium]